MAEAKNNAKSQISASCVSSICVCKAGKGSNSNCDKGATKRTGRLLRLPWKVLCGIPRPYGDQENRIFLFHVLEYLQLAPVLNRGWTVEPQANKEIFPKIQGEDRICCHSTSVLHFAIKATLLTKQVSTAASLAAVGCCLQGFARNLAIDADWENIYGIEAFHEWHLFKIQHGSARWMRAKITTNMSHFLSYTYLTKRMWECRTLPFYRKTKHECFFKLFNLFKRPQVVTRLNWAVALQFACYIDIPWISARWIGIPVGGFVCLVEIDTVCVVFHLVNQLNDQGPKQIIVSSSQFSAYPVILLMEDLLHQLVDRLPMFTPLFSWVLYIPGGCLGFLNHHQYLWVLW